MKVRHPRERVTVMLSVTSASIMVLWGLVGLFSFMRSGDGGKISSVYYELLQRKYILAGAMSAQQQEKHCGFIEEPWTDKTNQCEISYFGS